ncbi:MAG: hypothetical protein FJZ90_12225 [Chloroflexi bacterium]|nr:hypothetical protein [Chloroflexota bacterium]
MTYREFYRRHLPHWQPADAVLFVTFRLAGSLPQHVLQALDQEREQARKASAAIADPAARRKQDNLDERRHFGRWDRALDSDTEGPRWLGQPEIAEVVVEALHHRDGHVYDLFAYCVMPNHVHLAGRIGNTAHVGRIGNPPYGSAAAGSAGVGRIDNPTYFPLQKVMQSLKRHTARQANLRLGREGPFWQAESYDHVVRDAAELERVVSYVLNNPVKAGLVDSWDNWPWSYCKWEP